MNLERAAELFVSQMCSEIWNEAPKNHICGLLEEAVEVAHASDLLSEQECLEKLKAIVKRVYQERRPAFTEQPQKLHGELVDLVVMACCVRQQTAFMGNDPLLHGALDKIQALRAKWVSDPEPFARKLRNKQLSKIRFVD